jgi:hypothetical protein
MTSLLGADCSAGRADDLTLGLAACGSDTAPSATYPTIWLKRMAARVAKMKPSPVRWISPKA